MLHYSKRETHPECKKQKLVASVSGLQSKQQLDYADQKQAFARSAREICKDNDHDYEALVQSFDYLFKYLQHDKCPSKITSIKKYNEIYNIGSTCKYCQMEQKLNKKNTVYFVV